MTNLFYVEFDRDKFHLHNKMSAWCTEQFGEGRWYVPGSLSNDVLDNNYLDVKWFEHEMFGNYTFMFRNEGDAMFFSLKWS